MTTIDRRNLRRVAAGWAAAVAILTVAWALWVDRELHDLRWKLRTGDVLRYRTAQVMGSKGNETHQEMVSRYTVGKVSSDGSAEVTLFVERTTIRRGSPDGPVVWDSAAESPVPKDFGVVSAAAMTGIPLRHEIDATGKILSFEGSDEIKLRMRNFMGGDLFGLAEIVSSALGGSLLGPMLPRKPVARGARWSVEGSSGTHAWGKFTHVSIYALDKVQGGEAVISLVDSKVVDTEPGEVAKALKIDRRPPDPAEDKGAELTAIFSIQDGILLSERNRTWTQGTTATGKVFRFESISETTLIERRSEAGP